MPQEELLLENIGAKHEDISKFRALFPSVATARALTNTDMFTLAADDLRPLLDEYPGTMAILGEMALR